MKNYFYGLEKRQGPCGPGAFFAIIRGTMSVTETTTVGWGSRLGSSFKGILRGIVMFVAGIPLLFWNEGRAVSTTKTNDEGAASVVEADVQSVDPAQEGKLVHLVGEATTADVLSDEAYGVSETAIRLERKIEMYQWVESADTREEKKLGGKIERTTVYSYSKEWCGSAVDSDGFKESGHVNPPARVTLGLTEQSARNVTLGVRRLTDAQIARIGGSVPLKTMYQPVTTNEFFEITGTVPEPKVGDIRVTFGVTRPHVVTVVAAQRGDSFTPYTAKTGRSISHVMEGAVDAAGVFAAAERGNTFLTWILRLVGLLLMYWGVSAVLRPLQVLADVVPFIGAIVGFGIGAVAFAIAVPCALTTIAVAWIFYRPVVGITLLAIAAAIVAFVIIRRKKAA